MIDPTLLKGTGTDPLTLEQVYEMESTSRITSTTSSAQVLVQNTGDKIMTVSGTEAQLRRILISCGRADVYHPRKWRG